MFCSKCGKEINDEAVICVHCGCQVHNSKRGASNIQLKDCPADIKNKFNWGAFLFTWIWGIAHKQYHTLWILLAAIIPPLALGLSIYYGIKGNEWAWNSKEWTSVESFHNQQKKWIFIGLAISVVMTIVFVIIPAIIFAIIYDPKEIEINSFIRNATSIQHGENSYYLYYPSGSKKEYCTNIELVEGKPIKTKCSDDPEKLKSFRRCYEDRSIGSMLGKKGDVAMGFMQLAEINTYLSGNYDPEYARETSLFSTCELMTRGTYTKSQEEIKQDINYLKSQLKEAKDIKVPVTCYYNFFDAPYEENIPYCSKKNIKVLDEKFNENREAYEEDSKKSGVTAKCLYYEMIGVGKEDSCSEEEVAKVKKYLTKLAEEEFEYDPDPINGDKTVEEKSIEKIEKTQQNKKESGVQKSVSKQQETTKAKTVVPQEQHVQVQQNIKDIDDFMN